MVLGVPFYAADPSAPGGWIINTAAFSIPADRMQGDLGRDAPRGFGATQINSPCGGSSCSPSASGCRRARMFNIFNHPNFGSPVNYLSSPLLAQATQTLNSYLGSGYPRNRSG